jgi:hypothetical protein
MSQEKYAFLFRTFDALISKLREKMPQRSPTCFGRRWVSTACNDEKARNAQLGQSIFAPNIQRL